MELKRFDAGASRGMRRLRLGFTAALLSAFALAALYFTLGLVEDPALRYRVDLSEVGRNTLDPATEDLLGRLEEPVVAHVFFRRENSVADVAREDARQRIMDLFLVATKLAPDRFDMQLHDMAAIADVQAEFQRLGLGAEELRSPTINLVVLEQGERRALVRLEPDIAELGPDPLDPQKVAVVAFRGEEAFVDGLLKVASENRPKVYFSIGHGEARLEDTGALGLSSLQSALAGDGFDLFEWNPTENGPLPDDAAVLAVMAPTDAFAEDEVRFVEEFVERGGRLLVLQNENAAGGAADLQGVLQRFGIVVRRGIVCVPTLSQDLGQFTTGLPRCAQFQIELSGLNSSHPITKPLWAAARKVPVVRSLAFERGGLSSKGVLQDLLVQRQQHAWADLPGPDGRLDYTWDFSNEASGPFSLAMAGELKLDAAGGSEAVDGTEATEATEARVVAIGSGVMGANQLFGESSRDFMLNVFNWLAERDFNVRIGFRKDTRSQLDIVRGTEILWVRRFAWFGLPGGLLLIGIVLAWRRRS